MSEEKQLTKEQIKEQRLAQKAEQEYNEQMGLRVAKLQELQKDGRDPFDVYSVNVTHSSKQIADNYEELEGKEVTVAGRLMSKRVHGKAGFSDIFDKDGKIQMYIKVDDVGAEKIQEFKSFNIGDILSVTGLVFKTQTGEVSIHIKDFQLVCKSIRPLPEKWHGLKDPDLRYRHREVDVIMNPEVKERLRNRSKIIRYVREFLDNMDYLEVETPILSPIASGAAARPFVTHHNSLGIDMHLRIATELFLKRLIVAGYDRVYDLGKNFRNEGIDIRHNPEFTMIELYQAYADYNDMMEITENMISYVSQKVLGTMKVNYQGTEIDLTPPWRRITMVDAVKEHAGVDFSQIKTDEEAQALAIEKHLEFKKDIKHCTKGDILNAFFEEYAEEKMIQPTFICDYPVEISPLTKKKRGNEEFTERFEGFIYGREICNSYSELNDPIVQRQRFEQQANERELGDDEAYQIDEDFMYSLEIGMPPTGGLGIGLDRIIMFLTDAYSIRDVIPFPTMKPLSTGSESSKEAPALAHKVSEKADSVCENIDFSKVEIEPLFKDCIDFETFAKSDFRAVKVKECTAVPKSAKLLKFVLDDGSGEDRVILSGIHDTYEPEELIGKTLIAITNLPPKKMMGIDSCGMIISAVHHEEGVEKLHCLMVDDHIPAGAKLY
ncbi:lysyl-tRNA synthetase, class II [Hathewaya proteolytica DSM 3090]|uniref:Lysine--tRNA ligase n=1 Tax=Hathewaya proteolytica DSM 3090 TaxID=1121331 RepID=A0A1M6M8J8_9CLOT|nr:lysine--tRNA ligase [Hathewaya proteolytica]SHJ79752.1 lysyl-tRNA synthetase, class II [Hathewaya proteolytica DSM 3090]